MDEAKLQAKKDVFARKLIKSREATGRTANAMIYKSGLSQMQIRHLENGETNYTIESLLKYANALNLELELTKG